MTNLRIVVVGGGPVGLFAALFAARRGHAVTVLERRDGDGDKACGEGLMPPAVAALHAVDVCPRGHSFDGIRYLDAAGRHQVRADLASGSGLGVRRTELVRALRHAADDAGVEHVPAAVVDVEASAGGDGAASVSDDRGRSWVGDLVLGCDGLGSVVRQAIGVDRPAQGQHRYGLVAHFATAPWTSDVEVHWGSRGEAYVTPLGEHLIGVALLGVKGGSFRDRLGEMVALRGRLSGKEPLGGVLGAGPMRRVAATPVRGRVALVGDAAGYVDALTGEGLAIGFAGAAAAVGAAERDDLRAYASTWRTITRTPGFVTNSLVRATQHAGIRGALVPTAEKVPAIFGHMVRMLS
jgi:flavin-dependent dehydrogenase